MLELGSLRACPPNIGVKILQLETFHFFIKSFCSAELLLIDTSYTATKIRYSSAACVNGKISAGLGNRCMMHPDLANLISILISLKPAGNAVLPWQRTQQNTAYVYRHTKRGKYKVQAPTQQNNYNMSMQKEYYTQINHKIYTCN